MRKLALVLMLFALLPACDDDPVSPPVDDSPTFMALTTREAVLNNFELAWNQRRADKIDELLDADYAFYFATSDVGGEIPTSWDRAADLASTSALFNSNTVPPSRGPICTSVRVDLNLAGVTWVEVPGPAALGGEVWYTTTVFYSYTFEMAPDMTFIAQNGARATFTVRPVGGEWRLVEWSDLGSSIATTSNDEVSEQESTWGGIKALYREFQPLTSRTAVLHNIEFAWNQRSSAKVDELLDDNFTFFFSPGDVGGEIPEQWGRADELATTTALFTSNAVSTTGPVCTSVRVDLQFQPSTLTWVEIIPEESPNEVWYSATVFYSAVFEMEPNTTYIMAGGSKAQFTVREVLVGSETEWRLVEWRDLGSSIVASSSGTVSEQTTTWGLVKSLYR